MNPPLVLHPLGALPDWTQFRRVCVDVETRDPDLEDLGPGCRRRGADCYIVGASFACDDGTPNGPGFYLPVRHEGGGNYPDPGRVFAYLRDMGRRFRGVLALMNGQYDLDWLLTEGVEFSPRFFRDVQVSASLLDTPPAFGPPTPMNLDAIAKREGVPGKDEEGIRAYAERHKLHPKKDLWRMPARVVGPYAVRDVRVPLEILDRHERRIADEDLQQVYDLESRLLPVLLRMRRRGVAVRLDRVDQVEARAAEHEREACGVITTVSGVNITPDDLATSAALARALAADGVTCPLTDTGQPSVTAPFLAKLGTPVAKAIIKAKRWNKIRTTFCASVRRHAVRGRIHPTFNQLRGESEDGEDRGAAFGRLSCSAPNLQQQPARDPEIGPLWRSIYVPDDGGQWACLDFSSQEPRLITHYADQLAADPNLHMRPEVRAAAVAAAHACRTDPRWDNHSMMAGFIYPDYTHEKYKAGDKKAKQQRDQAKIIFLGKCYGMGGGKLCVSLGLPIVHMVRDRDTVGWSDAHSVDSPEGRALLAKGCKPFAAAGPEGQRLLDDFARGVPYVAMLAKMVQNKAQGAGFIRTLLGRRCRFPRGADGRIEWAHKGLNRLIQGGSADQTKLAMVLADADGIPLQLQVHDELDLTCDLATARRLKEIMEHAVELRVPSKCDVEMGPDWGHLEAVT